MFSRLQLSFWRLTTWTQNALNTPGGLGHSLWRKIWMGHMRSSIGTLSLLNFAPKRVTFEQAEQVPCWNDPFKFCAIASDLNRKGYWERSGLYNRCLWVAVHSSSLPIRGKFQRIRARERKLVVFWIDWRNAKNRTKNPIDRDCF